MTRTINLMILLIAMFSNIQSIVFAAGSISVSAEKTDLVIYDEITGTVSITPPSKPQDTNEIRYIGDVTATTPTVTGLYTPTSTTQNPNPASTNESGVTSVSSSAFKFKGNKLGTWKETFKVSFSVATSVYNPTTNSWADGQPHSLSSAETSITFTVKTITMSVSADEYIPLKSTLNPDRYAVTITAEPTPVSGTITLTASDKLNLYSAATGGNASSTLSLDATASSYTIYMEGKEVSQAVQDQTLTATYSVEGTSSATKKVTVCSVEIAAPRWIANSTDKAKRGSVTLSYKPDNLDKTKITLSGDTSNFNFYEKVIDPNTNQETELTAPTSWNLPRSNNSIVISAEGKTTNDGKLSVTHDPSGAKFEINAGVAEIDLVIDGLAEDKEESPGAFLGVKKRKSLSLSVKPSTATGDAVLSLTGLELYEVETGGTPIDKRTWTLSSTQSFPKTLYLGGSVSSDLRDKEATLTFMSISDKALATVLDGALTPYTYNTAHFDKGSCEGGNAYIHWNIDNDDNSNQDVGGPTHPGGDYLQDTYDGNIDDTDLITCNTSLSPDPDKLKIGTIKINVGENKIWKAQNKNVGSTNNLLLSGEESWDISDATQRTAFKKLIAGAFHEGMKKDDQEYTYEYIPPVGETIQFNKWDVHNISANCGRQPYLSVSTYRGSFSERDVLEGFFASLVRCEWSVTEPMSDQYNCFAWSVGIDSQILMADRDYSEAEFDAFYDSHNYIPCGRDEAEILLYKDATNIKHAARKKDGCTCGSGKWIMFESKLGPLTRIEHRRDQINGGTYGNHYRYYKKR